MNAHTFVVHPATHEQESALKSFFEAFKIKFETISQKAYDKDFVKMVLDAEKEVKQGQGKKIKSEDFDTLWT